PCVRARRVRGPAVCLTRPYGRECDPVARPGTGRHRGRSPARTDRRRGRSDADGHPAYRRHRQNGDSAMRTFLGVDIGTSSSKGAGVDAGGRGRAVAVGEHAVSRPRPGHVEMDADVWWAEFQDIAAELTATSTGEVAAVGVSGMGPCVLVTDEAGNPLRPA